MANIICGYDDCKKHGKFEWRRYILKNDSISGRWDELTKNCENVEKIDGKYKASIYCPKCRRTYEKTYADNEVIIM